MLPVQELATNLNLSKKELVIPIDAQKYFYVDPENTKGFIDQVMDLEETDMKFFNVKQSQPYSNSLDQATIVNNSGATVTQQETFTKTTTDSFTFTNTKGFTKGGSVNATIGTPFLGGVGTTLNLSFNLSMTSSTAKTVSQSRSQQQTITVPAQTSLVATWVIKNVDVDADYKMTLKAGQKPAVKAGLIPGKFVTTDQPIVPVYKYTDDKGEKFMYFPSNALELENWHLDHVNPVFYIPQQPTNQSYAVQAGGGSRIKSLFKGIHNDSKALVPVNSTGSAFQDISIPASKNSVATPESFHISSQYLSGAVSLWRYRKEGVAETPSYRLEASLSPEAIPGWVNEGSLGFVYSSIPGMRDAEIKTNGHPHALNEVVPDKEKELLKSKKKCSKCWKKIDFHDPYFRCEQCKTFVECTDCYAASDRAAQKGIEEAVNNFYEILERLADYKKVFTVTGRMHGTQGTHTFISIAPLADKDKEAAQQQATQAQKETKEEDKEEEKVHKAKKYIEEFKYKKQYVEEASASKSKSHTKTEKVTEMLPLPPPPPPLPTSSSVTIEEPLPLPPPPPPLPSATTGYQSNPYYTTPLQSFINNPSTVQPYFAPAPAPPPPPPPFIPGPIPTTSRTIETKYVLKPTAKNGTRALPTPSAPPPAPTPSAPPVTLRRGSIDDIYSIPMHMYASIDSPRTASPSWGRYDSQQPQQPNNYQGYAQQSYQQPSYDQNYNQQGNYTYNEQNYNEPNYSQQNYGTQQNYEQNYDQNNNYQGYNQNYNQNYNSPQGFDKPMASANMQSFPSYQPQPQPQPQPLPQGHHLRGRLFGRR